MTSAYGPEYSSHFVADIHKLISISNNEYFIFGDFNAKHSSWNCSKNNNAGNDLFNLQNQNDFFIYYLDSPTYFSTSSSRNHQSTLDILLSNSNLTLDSCIGR